MVQEYLFVDAEKRLDIEAYQPDNVIIDYADINRTDCWIVSYSVDGENENSAKILSSVNDYIAKNFSPTVLTNGCSAYFNKLLFPHINEFERKLRKLLYLKCAINKDDKATENIKNLETEDLGKIFNLLFTDSDFVAKVKEKISRSISWPFTKSEIVAIIRSISENTVWDHLIGCETVPSLRNDFIVVKDYRNHVMHAHNINMKTYHDARKLFEDINKQLDIEIGIIISSPPNSPRTNYNSHLSEALKNMDTGLSQQAVISTTNFFSTLVEWQNLLSGLNIPLSESLKMQELSELAKSIQLSPKYLALQEQLAKLKELVLPSPEIAKLLQQISEIKKPMQDFTEENEMNNT